MNIIEFRQQFPEYNDLSDVDLTKSLHQKYYSDIPYQDFAAEFVTPTKAQVMGEASLSDRIFGGLGQGLTTAARGIKQLGMTVGEKVGIVPEGETQKYTKEIDEENRLWSETPVGQSKVGKVSSVVGQALPYMLVPGGVAGGIGTRLATGAASGALMGATNYVPEGGSRALNTAIGAVTGGAAPLVTAGAAKGYNALKGNYADDAAKTVDELGKKFDVDVFASDAAQTPGLKGTAMALENAPPGINIKPDRFKQLAQGRTAAEKLTNQFEDEMLAMPFGGRTGVKQLQKAAASSDSIRSKAAKQLLQEINNSGDDWNKIIETSGNLKLFRSKLIADKKYNKVSELADQFGAVGKNNTLSAIDNAINEAKNSVLPDEGLIKTLQTLKNNFSTKNLNYSGMRQARGDVSAQIDSFYTGGNAAVGKKGVGLLQGVKDAIGRDMDSFAQSNGKQLKTVWQNADNFYRNGVAPYKDVQLAKALTNASPDEIYNKFITTGSREGGKGTSRAQRFYNALDNKGRAAVRYGIVSEAFEKSIIPDTNKFSPAIFANKLDDTTAARGVFFKGQDKAEVDGFKNLMRHIDRAAVAANKPETGVKWIPVFLSALGAGGLFFNPVLTGAVAGMGYGARKALTTEAGKRFLLSASKLKAGTPAMQKLVDSIEQTIQRTIVATGTSEQQRAANEMPR